MTSLDSSVENRSENRLEKCLDDQDEKSLECYICDSMSVRPSSDLQSGEHIA